MLNLFSMILVCKASTLFFTNRQNSFLVMAVVYIDQQEPSIGFSHSPLYLQSGSNNDYFSRLDLLI
jgi:hypothetical protein